MHFIFYCEDKPDSLERRHAARPAHVERLEGLKEEGRLFVAGPLYQDDAENSTVNGSLIIAEFSDLETAKAWIEADPYVTADVYANIIVRPFKVVL